jgi:tRNA-modifying protein YgfZ
MTLINPPASTMATAAPAPESLAAPVLCVDTGLALLEFDGPDAQSFLQGQLSNDVTALAAGRAQWTSYNSPKGRMLATLLLWQAGAQSFRALVAADLAAMLAKRLSMFVMRAKVAVTDLTPTCAIFGVGGPGAGAAIHAALGVSPESGEVVARDDATTIGLPDGRLIVVTNEPEAIGTRLAACATPVGTDVWCWLGVHAGIPVIGAATQDLFVPQTANWDLIGGVSFQKGCYPGQEIVARTQYLGRLKERLQLFHADGEPPAPGVRLFGTTFGDQACGTVVNSARSPGGGSDLLAVVQLAALDAPPLRLGSSVGPTLALRSLPYAIPVPVAPERPKL